jgi:DNA polymerase III delta subunit
MAPLSPAYFFLGEDVYPALEFIDKAQKKLSGSEQEVPVIERYELGINSWADIIDSARTVPLLSSSYRLVVVEIPPRKKETLPRKEENLSSGEEALLKSYLSSPSEKTILIIIFNQKIVGGSPLLKFFKALPPGSIDIEELNPFKGQKIYTWIKKQVQKEGKKINHYACLRLVELVGNDLRRLRSEIDKLVTFVDERDLISIEDVEQISGWVKPFIEWEITNSLEEADYKKCLFTLDKLIEKENISSVKIMDIVSGFFNDILLVKLRILEGNKDRKAVFKEIKPFIPDKFRDLYQRKFKEIIHFAEQISIKDLKYFIEKLKDIDLKIKSTSLSFHELMDGFLFDYCQRRAGEKKLF